MSTPPVTETEPVSAEQAGTGVVSNTLFGLLAQVTTTAFTTILTLYLVRQLGPDRYGLFSLALSVGAVLLMISDFGLAASTGRYVAEREAEVTHARKVTDTALRLKIAGALAMAIALALTAPLIAGAYGKPTLTTPLRAAAASLFFESMILLYSSAFSALRRQKLNARMIFLESSAETLASIALVAMGGGVTGALFGRAAGYAVGTLAGAVLLGRYLGRPRLQRRAEHPELSGAIVHYARPLLVVNGAYILYSYIDALLIGALLTTRDVGEFTAPLRIIAVLGYLATSVGSAVAPRMAGENPDVRLFSSGIRLMLLVQTLIVVPLMVWSQPLVDLLLGHDYHLAGNVLRALTPYTFLFGISPLISMTVTYSGDARRRVPIVLFSLAVNVVIDLILLPTIGVIGAAIGTGVALAVFVPAHLRVCRQSFDFPIAPLVRTALAAIAAAVPAAGLLFALGTDHLATWQWLTGVVGAPAVYLAGLLALRQVTPAELRRMPGILRRR